MPPTAPHEVLLMVAQGEVEANLLCSLLQNHGIPCRTQGESLRVTHMFTVDGLGAVRLYVPSDREEEARELLRAVNLGALELDEEDDQGLGTPREKWKDLE